MQRGRARAQLRRRPERVRSHAARRAQARRQGHTSDQRQQDRVHSPARRLQAQSPDSRPGHGFQARNC